MDVAPCDIFLGFSEEVLLEVVPEVALHSVHCFAVLEVVGGDEFVHTGDGDRGYELQEVG